MKARFLYLLGSATSLIAAIALAQPAAPDDGDVQYWNATNSQIEWSTEAVLTSSGALDDSLVDHGSTGGLGDDDHTQYCLLAGRSGGQTVKGGTGSGDDLTLQSTNHATRGNIHLGSNSTYDEANTKLGIGETSPQGTLHIATATTTGALISTDADEAVFEEAGDSAGITIASDTNQFGNVYFADSGGNSRGFCSYNHSTDDLVLGSAGSTRVTIDSSGQVGINDTSPSAQLHVSKGSSGSSPSSFANVLLLEDNTSNGMSILVPDGSTGTMYFGDEDDADNGIIQYVNSAQPEMEFYVGTSSATGRIKKIEMNSIVTNVFSDASAAGTVIFQMRSDYPSSNSQKWRVEADGDTRSTTGLYTTISDRTIKQDIVDTDPASDLDGVLNLRPKRYRLKDEVANDPNARVHLGLVAQDVEAVFPDLVKSIDWDGEDLKAIESSSLVFKLIGAVQGLSAKLSAAEARIAILEARGGPPVQPPLQ